jgi:hypothetical protein
MAKYPQEITKYPQESNILYKEKNHNFQYTILQEGVYPSEPHLKYTLSDHYKIPDNYKVKTTWGKKTVKCSINYINNKPVFRVYFVKILKVMWNQIRLLLMLQHYYIM